MNCLKCNCGCDRLSKDELEKLINSSSRGNDFIQNKTACDMFRKMFYSGNPDTYVPQPSSSQQRPVGKSKPRAIKYLELIEECQELLKVTDLSDEVVEEFANRVPDLTLGDALQNSTSLNRTENLEAIVKAYSNKLYETEQYKSFQEKLVKAYQGKLMLEK